MINTRLTAEDVLAIHSRLLDGDSGVSIARDFGVSQQTVSSIRTGECWGNVTGLSPRTPGEHTGRGKLSRPDVLAISEELRRGARAIDLAKQYGVSHNTIYLIRTGRIWAWLTGRPVCERTKP